MNKDWSELNKTMQLLLKKEESMHAGIKTLVDLRNQLMDVLLSFKKDLKRADFDAIPFMNASGYHCKTIGYSIWHIFRARIRKGSLPGRRTLRTVSGKRAGTSVSFCIWTL